LNSIITKENFQNYKSKKSRPGGLDFFSPLLVFLPSPKVGTAFKLLWVKNDFPPWQVFDKIKVTRRGRCFLPPTHEQVKNPHYA